MEAAADATVVKLGYNRQRVIDLFRFVDWVLQLPEPQALAFWQELREMEEEKRMQYVTSVERIGMEQGLKKGLQQGMEHMQQNQADMVLRVLSRRFGGVPSNLASRVRSVSSEQMLELLDLALAAGSLEEVAEAVAALAVDVGASEGGEMQE